MIETGCIVTGVKSAHFSNKRQQGLVLIQTPEFIFKKEQNEKTFT